MGFRPDPTVYNLKFEGTSLDGLHVKIGCCTLREFNTMMRFSPSGDPSEASEHNDQVVDLFLRYLVSWDLENPHDGKPTPKTKEGLDPHEPSLIRHLVSSWQIAMVNVPLPLQMQSTNGSTSEELSLGLGTLSESLPNSSTPT